MKVIHMHHLPQARTNLKTQETATCGEDVAPVIRLLQVCHPELPQTARPDPWRCVGRQSLRQLQPGLRHHLLREGVPAVVCCRSHALHRSVWCTRTPCGKDASLCTGLCCKLAPAELHVCRACCLVLLRPAVQQYQHHPVEASRHAQPHEHWQTLQRGLEQRKLVSGTGLLSKKEASVSPARQCTVLFGMANRQGSEVRHLSQPDSTPGPF